MLVFPSLGSQAEAAQNRPRDSDVRGTTYSIRKRKRGQYISRSFTYLYRQPSESSGQRSVAGCPILPRVFREEGGGFDFLSGKAGPPEGPGKHSPLRTTLQPPPSLPIPLPPRPPALQIRIESQTLHPGKRPHRQQIPNLFPNSLPTLLQNDVRRQHINIGGRISLLPLPARRVNRLHIISPAVQPPRSLNLHPQQPPARPRPNNKVILLAVAPRQRQPKSQRLRLHQERRLRHLPIRLGFLFSRFPQDSSGSSATAMMQGMYPGTAGPS